MPPIIRNFIEDQLKTGDVKVTILNVSENGSAELGRSELLFNSEGTIKGSIESILTIYGYLDRLVKYSRKNIQIYINNNLLTDIKPRAIYQIEYIPELPQSKAANSEKSS